MNIEEKIKLAQSMRQGNPFGSIDREVFQKLDCTETEKTIEYGGEKVKIFEICSNHNLKNKTCLIINFHGGGFIKGIYDRDKLYCMSLANRLGARIWDVDYSLSPEYPFPKAANEAYAITQYAFENADALHIEDKKIIIVGHSAGANLVFGVCLRAQTDGGHTPRAIITDYTPVDMAVRSVDKLSEEAKKDERKLARAKMEDLYAQFYTENSNAKNPLISPMYASDSQLSKLPKLLFIYAGLDSLFEDDQAFSKRLEKLCNDVKIQLFEQSPHGFVINRNGQWEEALHLHYEFLENIYNGGDNV